MKKGAYVAAVAFLFLALAVQAQPLAKPVPETRCIDTGSFSVSNLDESGKSVSIKKSGGPSREVTGSWREMSNGLFKFTSDDMAVVDVSGGYYSIVVDKKSYGVTCPPFKFSCKLINLTINGCYKRNDTFFGKYSAYSFRYDKKNEFRFEKPFMLTYEVVATAGEKKKELTHSPSAVSPDFEVINLTRIRRVGSNLYTLKWQTPFEVSRFKIKYDDCDTAKYAFYDSFDCSGRPSCNSAGECLQSERCDDSLCIPISCAACQYVANHTCVDYECCGDADCDTGHVCGSGNSCEELSCAYNEHVSGQGCEDLECAQDEYVSNHSCSKLNCKETETAVNHACKTIECADDEAIQNRGCQRLKCGFLKKAKSHGCVSVFSLWFGRK